MSSGRARGSGPAAGAGPGGGRQHPHRGARRAAGSGDPAAGEPGADVVDRIVEEVGRAAARHDEAVERAAEKTAAKLERAAAKLDQASVKAVEHAARLEQMSTRLRRLDLWTRDERETRQPRFTRDEIAAAAVRIADTEGLEALSMRRLATELDSGVMTLYHYVDTKAELLALAHDTVIGEMLVPESDPFPEDWRRAVTLIAERGRSMQLRHPWAFSLLHSTPPGPNSARHLEQSLRAVAALPVDLAGKLDILSAVDEYVAGHSLFEQAGFGGTGGVADADADAAMVRYIEGLFATGRYPMFESLAGRGDTGAAWRSLVRYFRDPHRFRRNLDRLLDGIAADLGLP